MSAKNRGDRIQQLQKAVNKHYTPVMPPDDRSVLEHMIFACCLQDEPYEDADEAFNRMRESFFDWNEVRVTTVTELRETMHNLADPTAAAARVKKVLQALFETRYSFDIDDMIKMNLGKAVEELEGLAGMTKFVLGYMTQNALGGHAIPVSDHIMTILRVTEVVSESEAAKGSTPGLERTIPKTKGPAFASCLHQLAIEAVRSPDSKQVKAALKDAGATMPLPVEEKPSAAAKSSKSKSTAAKKTADKTAEKAPEKPASSTKSAKAKPPAKKAATPKAAAKSTAKSAPTKGAKAKSAAAKKPAKPAAGSSNKTTKRKPR